MTRFCRRALLASAIGLVPSAAGAQTCFRGGPLPRCHQFVALEMDWSHSVGTGVQNPWVLSWALGAMANSGSRSAFGGALLIASDDDGHRIGLQGRYRRWLGGRTALDLTPAVFVGGHRNGGGGADGVGIGVAVTQWDLIGVTLNYQMADGAGRLYAGIRLGSWMVPVGTAGLIAALAATFN